MYIFHGIYCWWHGVNTLRPRRNGRHFADDTFKRIFLNENVWIPIKISLKFVPKGPINNIPALVQIMAWRRPGDKPLSEPMMVILLTYISVTRPQWVKYSDEHRCGFVAFAWGQFLVKILEISLLDITLKMTNLRLQPYLSGANELRMCIRSVPNLTIMWGKLSDIWMKRLAVLFKPVHYLRQWWSSSLVLRPDELSIHSLTLSVIPGTIHNLVLIIKAEWCMYSSRK